MSVSYATSEALDRAVIRLEAAMTRGFEKMAGSVDSVATIAHLHSVQITRDEYRITQLEQDALRLQSNRWQLWALILTAAGVLATVVSGVIVWFIR
jgi:hypothetical protein